MPESWRVWRVAALLSETAWRLRGVAKAVAARRKAMRMVFMITVMERFERCSGSCDVDGGERMMGLKG